MRIPQSVVVTDQRTRLTFRWERWRAVTAGILESAGSTFLLLIAVRWFEAGATAKSLIAAGGSVGLLLSPLVVSEVAALGWPVAVAAARLAAVGTACFLVTWLWPVLPVFVVGSVLAMACSAAVIPLMTQIYQENYPESDRGRLFSKAMMIRIGVAAGFSQLAGTALSGANISRFRWLLLVFALAYAFGSFCLSRCPSQALTVVGGTHPFRAMRFVREDRLFRWTLGAWMLMGFANLMMIPLRVEYLANPRYGLALDVSLVALLVGVIPNLARLVMSPIWGWLFDRMNFFSLRVIVNFGFGLGIVSFFTSHNTPGLVFGAIVFGISNAGGDVAWSLWVTKFAPPERVADYMSVHTFFTGVRGVVAPAVAFQLIRVLPIAKLGWISAALIGGSMLMLLTEVKWGRTGRRGAVLVEEVSE